MKLADLDLTPFKNAPNHKVFFTLVADFLEQQENKKREGYIEDFAFDMCTWFDQVDKGCGTVACIGGTMQIVLGLRDVDGYCHAPLVFDWLTKCFELRKMALRALFYPGDEEFESEGVIDLYDIKAHHAVMMLRELCYYEVSDITPEMVMKYWNEVVKGD